MRTRQKLQRKTIMIGSVREHTDWLKEVSGRSDFRANLEISAYDRVFTLSTCAYRFENARYVLHGKLVEL